MIIWPLKAATFWRIFCWRPIPVATDMIIIIIPRAMAMMAIFIIGAEILLVWSLAAISRFAIKYSKFNLIWYLIPFYFVRLLLLVSKIRVYSCF